MNIGLSRSDSAVLICTVRGSPVFLEVIMLEAPVTRTNERRSRLVSMQSYNILTLNTLKERFFRRSHLGNLGYLLKNSFSCMITKDKGAFRNTTVSSAESALSP